MKKATFQLFSFPNTNKVKQILDFYCKHGVLINYDSLTVKCTIEATADIATLCNLANSLGRENVLCIATNMEDVTARPVTTEQWVSPVQIIADKIKSQSKGGLLYV